MHIHVLNAQFPNVALHTLPFFMEQAHYGICLLFLLSLITRANLCMLEILIVRLDLILRYPLNDDLLLLRKCISTLSNHAMRLMCLLYEPAA